MAAFDWRMVAKKKRQATRNPVTRENWVFIQVVWIFRSLMGKLS